MQPLKPRETVQGTPFGHALALLADPFVVQLICRTLSRKLHDVLKSQSLPKDHALVPSLLQLLVMALTARTQLDPKHGDSVRETPTHHHLQLPGTGQQSHAAGGGGGLPSVCRSPGLA